LVWNPQDSAPITSGTHTDGVRLRVEFLLKTDSGYPKDAGGFFQFTMANPGTSLRFNTNWSALLVLVVGLLCRHIARNPITAGMHTSGVQ